jgi:hypothetical protein
MLAQFPQDVVTLLGRGRGQVIVADRDDAGYDGDDLSEVFVQGW